MPLLPENVVALGRIGGPLLDRNLKRKNAGSGEENLAFGNTSLVNPNVLYLDVINGRVGINTDVPSHDFLVNSSIRTTNLRVPTQTEIENFVVSTNTIQNISTSITISPDQTSDPIIDMVRIGTYDYSSSIAYLNISDQLIENKRNNSNIELSPNGTGAVNITTSKLYVDGNFTATGSVNWDGSLITLGSDDSDNVVFNADVNSNIIPDDNETWDLGTAAKRWDNIYSKNVSVENLIVNTAIVNNIDMLLTQGNTIYVSVNGLDTNIGTHLHNTYRTIKKALTVAAAGDTVVIFPGTYEEEFPLTVPAGVTVNGAGIRAVTIVPTVATEEQDCFLLNGETTVSHLTVKNFYYNTTNNTGYAFRFASNFTVTSRSPYVQNCSVITSASVTAPTGEITVGPAPTLFSFTSNSVTLAKEFYSQLLVDSLVGQTAVIDRYPLQPLFYTVVSVEDEPTSPTTQWKMTFNTTFDPTGQLKPISFYPDFGAIELVTNDIWDTTGNSIGEKWVAWYKTNLPVNFETTVQPGWSINVAGTLYIVDYIIQDPVNANMWRIYVTTSLVGGVGIPIFSSPIGASTKLAGRGALVDGSLATSSSKEASMLFHSVTMITPEVTALEATNGARVEWLDCFTYFADKGIHLTQGTEGFNPTDYVHDSTTGKYLPSNAIKLSLTADAPGATVNPVGANSFKFRTGTAVVTSGVFGSSVASAYDMTSLITSETAFAIYNHNTSTLVGLFTIWDSFIDNNLVAYWTDNATGPQQGQIIYPAGTSFATFRSLFTTGTTYDWVFVPNSSTFTGYKTAEELGIKFGAELRSIGSANIYGNYGAVADGADTIAYLINHNFAYIGLGTDYSNDPNLVIQANEVVEQNDGRIYYESTDHKGDFRIGDIFYVNQETGEVIFNAQSISFLPTGNITLTGPTSSAFIDATMVEVGNIRIYDNNIDSLIGPVNFSAFSGTTTLNTDVFVTGDTDISADVVVKGNLYLGNQPTDTVTIYPEFTQDLLPDDVGPAYGYTLGSAGASGKRWNTLFSNALTVDNVTNITNNTISTLTTNTDLILQASTTGKIRITNTNVQIDENLTVNGSTITINGVSNLQDLSVVGSLNQVGNWNQTGNTDIIGDVFADNIGIMDTGSYITVPNFKIQNNEISITSVDTDLILEGAGSGSVVFENIVKFSGTTIQVLPGVTLLESGDVFVTESGIPYAIEGDVNADENITFKPNGAGNTIIYGTNALKIPVGSNSTRSLNTGEIRFNNVTNLYEGGISTGLVSFSDIYDSDRNTYVKAGATDNTIYFGINNAVKATLDSTALKSATFKIDNVQLSSNTISNTVSGNDLIFTPTGTGNTVINNIGFSSDNTITNQSNQALTLKSTGAGYISFAAASAVIIPYGSSSERRLSPEIGEIRYNTNYPRLEVYTGDVLVGDSGWTSALGESSQIVDANIIEGLLDFWTLILG